MAKNRLGLRGYVTSRSFGRYTIPVPLQSLALRDYCTRNKYTYVLPVNENIFPHSYMVLEGMMKGLSDYHGIVMYSMHMLPQREERRRNLYKQILDQGCELHILLESVVLTNENDIEGLEELIQLNQIAAQLPKQPALESDG
jgi:sporadic carbohydrate cluster protein (TIGR04323 family)